MRITFDKPGAWAAIAGVALAMAYASGAMSSPATSPEEYTASKEEVAQIVAAVNAAYDHARAVGYDSFRKVTVVQKRGKFIVVSMLPEKGSRTLGGGSHHVYDPAQGKVVLTMVDD